MSYRMRLSLIAILSLSNAGLADDWAQWNGPKRTGEYSESGIIDSIPKDGLKQLWKAPVAGGYSGPSVAEGRVYVTDYVKSSGEATNNPSVRDELVGRERVLCLDATNGKQIWEYSYERSYAISYPAGPRVSPTIDSGMVYSLGAEGDLVCLDAKAGKLVWKRQLKDEYKATTPIWRYSASPLILGDQLITLAGGEGSIVVSLDKRTGKEIWRALSASETGYAPPTLVEKGGTQQLLVWDADKLNSLEPSTGKVLWSTELKPSYGMSIMSPVFSGNRMYLSGIGEVASMYELDSIKPGVKQLWKGGSREKAVYCGNSTPVFDGDYVYGADCGSGAMICMQASDGTRMWETFVPTAGGTRRASHGTAFLSKVGDRYFIFSETGDFIIAKLSPEKYEEIGRAHVIEPTNDCFGRAVVWSYPAYANKCLFVRNDKEIVCFSLAR